MDQDLKEMEVGVLRRSNDPSGLAAPPLVTGATSVHVPSRPEEPLVVSTTRKSILHYCYYWTDTSVVGAITSARQRQTTLSPSPSLPLVVACVHYLYNGHIGWALTVDT